MDMEKARMKNGKYIIIIAALLILIGLLVSRPTKIINKEVHSTQFIDSLIALPKIVKAEEEQLRKEQKEKDSIRINKSLQEIALLNRQLQSIILKKVDSDSLSNIVNQILPLQNDTLVKINLSQGRVLVESHLKIEPLYAIISTQRERIISDSLSSVLKEVSLNRQITALEQAGEAQAEKTENSEAENKDLRKELRKQRFKTTLVAIGGAVLIVLVAL